MRYAIVIEKSPSNYAAYVPDLPGCIATGATVAETESLIREAIEFHLEGLRADGLPVPPANSQVEYIDVAVWCEFKLEVQQRSIIAEGAQIVR